MMHMHGPAFFTPQTNLFLRKLAANNDRDWFAAHRAQYEDLIKHPANAFANTMATALEAENGTHFRSKILRIYRDQRFSNDKRPYNTHVRILFTSKDDGADPGYFFSLEPDELILGAGTFRYEKGDLDRFRQRVAGEEGEELERIAAALEQGGMRLSDPDLKRVPAPYRGDHPRAGLLRRKGLTAWIDALDCSTAYGTEAIDACMDGFRKLAPLYDWLAKTQD